ncbi:tripartite tricarboxylate transporter permease [Ammoniphilus sp. 3BR4]|uniref:tripartite tricarboxylate transporter permease n=1 Tax=Ammoniphilus sp. 3BR4 TaxID=3158265 RepID=UPI0034660DCE
MLLSLLFTLENLFVIIFGVLVGLVVGAIPGLGAAIAIALLVPVTFSLSPVAAILLLVTVYQASEYGNSVTAILMGVPGTPAAVPTIMDGNTMAKQGFPGKALGYSMTGSLVGGVVGVLALMFLAKPISSFAMGFSDPEMFLISVLALLCVGSLGTKDLPKSIISILLGLLVSTIGLDTLTGQSRFTFGSIHLMDGLSAIALLIGMFAIAEVLNMVSTDLNKKYVTDIKNLKTGITWKEFTDVKKYIVRSSVIGTFIGILPGLGASAASWFAYMDAKRSSKNPENFGKGEPGGIVAPDAANNAAVGGALVPLLSLGIPGSATMAIVLSAFLIHGIQPGPRIFETNFDLIAAIFWGFLGATILSYFFGRYTTSIMARMLMIPNYRLAPGILFISLIGAYAAHGNEFDLWIVLIAGIITFVLIKLDFAPAVFVLALIFGPMSEEYFRRSLMLSQGDYSVFYTSIYSIVLIILILIVIGFSIRRTWNERAAGSSDVKDHL